MCRKAVKKSFVLKKLSVKIATYASSYYNPYRVYPHEPDKHSTPYWNPTVLQIYMCGLCHAKGWRRNERNNGRTNTTEHGCYNRIVFKLMEKHRYEQYNKERG